MNFNELELNPALLRAVADLGFEQPTAIQEKIIPLIKNSGQDLIGLAQTGTGKTAAFGLPLLHKIDPETNHPQMLVLSPTRELCVQISKDMGTYAAHLPKIKIVAVYGGANIMGQMKDVKRGCQVIVGTPGRTLDLVKRKVLNLSRIDFLVLDEADEMLNMGFRDDLDAILEKANPDKQTLLFSATMPPDIRRIANTYMKQPEEVSSGEKNKGTADVSHEYYVTLAKNKYHALKRIVDINPKMYGIVFCRTRSDTKEIADKLMQDGYNADALHGDLSQAQRDFVMNRFRRRNIQILVATDVAARGLDVNDLTHVIHYNLPDDKESYIHRSGRTGRAGKKGRSVALIHSREHNKVRMIERMVGQKFEMKQVPTGKDICEKQLFNLIDKVENIEVNTEQIGPFMEVIYKKLSWLSREELIQHFVSVEFNRFLDYYKNAEDINLGLSKRDKREKPVFDKQNNAASFTRYHINVGTKNGLTVPKMIGIINDATNRRDIKIGRIDMMKGFTFFETDNSFDNLILKSFKNQKFQGVKLKVEKAQPDVHGGNKKPERKKKKGKRK